jgi:hypothetical protein
MEKSRKMVTSQSKTPTFSFLYGFHAIPIILLIMLINLLGHITYCYYLLYHVINTLPKKKQTMLQIMRDLKFLRIDGHV